MTQTAGQVRWLGWTVLLAVLAAGPLGAQQSRDSLVAQAQGEFDATRRTELLREALNPALGPLTGSWGTGVQLLAQTLLEDKQDSLARTWLRWAARLSPSLQADTVQFLPTVAAALRDAQGYAQRTAATGDAAVSTSYQWPGPGPRVSSGKLLVTAPGVGGGFRATAAGTPLTAGTPASLPPGSYLVSAGADTYDSIAVAREVLPGVTTRLEFKLRPQLAQGRPSGRTPSPASTIPADAEVKSHKKFPWAIVALGAVGAGVAVAALAGGGGDNGGGGPAPTTGGITIFFPNP
jgi:hypothetical protein